jgi:hypothetical protein
MNHLVSSRAFPFAVVGAVALGLASAFACSSGSAPATSDAPCTALSQCCLAMAVTTSGSCETLVTSARAANDEAACTSTLLSYTQGGLCGTTPITGADGGLPCALTNTCPGGSDGGFHLDTGKPSMDGPASTGCTEIGSCTDGETYEQCTTFNGSACAESFVFSGGTKIACAACGDCTSAQTAAQSFCGTTTTPVDAGVDAPVCGTSPALHPELEAGVYCAFTAGTPSNIHCSSGQQCCEAPSTSPSSSTCQLPGTCPIVGSIAWQCDGPVDCAGSPAGPVCCGVGGTVALDSTCGFNRGSSFTATHCGTSCSSNEVSICTEATDPCPTGETCTPFKVAGIVLGTCQ